MIPILYPAHETAFDSNGLGLLADAISCSVPEEINSKFELVLKYPVTGIHYSEIDYRTIILAQPDPITRAQPFRVYRMVPNSAGTVTVYARHLAYDLLGVPVSPFSINGVSAALNGLKQNAAVDCQFSFSTDKTTSGFFSVKVPTPAWRCLGGQEGSILDTYGGEFQFDRWTVWLKNQRGADRGVTIRYGKNLTSLEQDKNCAEVYTGVYPFWTDPEGVVTELYDPIVQAAGTYNFTNVLPLDCTQYFAEKPTQEQLRARAEKYITDNSIGVPKVSWKIQFVSLEQTDEYREYTQLERVQLGDTVTVIFPEMHVNASARVVAVDYDPIGERYNSITLGSVRSSLAQTIVQQGQLIKDKPSVSWVEAISMTLTARILGAIGGAVRLLDTDSDGLPDTLYVADDPDPNKAVKVWRWNYEGWAGSKNGYAGPYILGATLEDGLLAEAVTAACLVAGTIKSADDGKTFFLDLDNGVLKMNATQLTINGETVSAVAIANISQQDVFNKLTNNGTVKGIYMHNGQMYINASYLATGILSSVDGETFYLDLDKGILRMKASSLSISGKTVGDIAADEAEAAANAALSDAKDYADDAAVAAVEAQTQQDIFNILTNNGQDQGIYLQGGKIYINAEYLMAGQLSADKITLNGLFEVRGGKSSLTGASYLGGYLGYMTGNYQGLTTDGVAMYNKNKSCYAIVTSVGVRLQADDVCIWLTTEDAFVKVDGDLRVSGDIYYTGELKKITE